MKGIFSYYTKYFEHIDEYKNWSKGQSQQTASMNPQDIELLKKKAKAISEPILLLDSYEHEKAEDSETFFQTLNIELMSIAGVLTSLPAGVVKLIPILDKHAEKSSFLNKLVDGLKKYANNSISLFGKKIPLPKILTCIGAILGAAVFINGIKNSMKSQLGIIRKAGFDASQNIINDPKSFAQLTKEQDDEVNSIVNYEEKTKSTVNKLAERINVKSSFQEVKNYRSSLSSYEKDTKEYFDSLNQNNDTPLSNEKCNKAEQDKEFFTNYLKNVEHDVLEDLRKVETISNISYSSLFTGGFLEYLITDKLADLLKIQNKAIRMVIKIAVPLFTYLILNKNISNLENKVICATKYKHLKNFMEHPELYSQENENNKQKQSPKEFLKTVYNDLKEYEKFAQNELPKLKERNSAKKLINLTPAQAQEAKLLQKNTSMIINKHRKNVYEQTVGIKTLSETILGPLDIVATAIGGFLGHLLSKKISNHKLARVMIGLGAVVAFIPAAIAEAKLTKQQKLAEKIAAMLTIKDFNPKQFADYETSINSDFYQNLQGNSKIFSDFI